MDVVSSGLISSLTPLNILALLGGTLIGIITGFLPGIGAPLGLTLLLPIIFSWPPEAGLIILIALWMADNYGSAISSILIKVPGSTSGVFTMLDGHPMAQQGKSRIAIGLAMGASFFGGIFGALVFILTAPLIALLILRFSAAEYFWLSILGLSVIASTARGNTLKGFISAGLGLLLALIGIDMMHGFARFNYSSAYLFGGFELQVILLGIYGLAELVPLGAGVKETIAEVARLSGSIMQGFFQTFRYIKTMVRSSIIGVIIGALPGSGTTVASALAYQQAADGSKHPERFGQGEPEGLVAPETADNAVQGGTLIPTLTLGVPGSTSAAIFLGAMTIYGLRPGPEVFKTDPELVGVIFWGMILAAVAFVILGILLGDLFARMTLVPLAYLLPAIVALVIAGAFALRNNYTDMLVILGFGLFGYCLKAAKYQLIPLVLGFILEPIAEENYFRALLLEENPFKAMFGSVISVVLILLILATVLLPGFKRRRQSKGIPA